MFFHVESDFYIYDLVMHPVYFQINFRCVPVVSFSIIYGLARSQPGTEPNSRSIEVG
jgi:hypothetical protein